MTAGLDLGDRDNFLCLIDIQSGEIARGCQDTIDQPCAGDSLKTKAFGVQLPKCSALSFQ